MNNTLALKKISSFQPLLTAYRDAGHGFANAVDGGAGAGHTAKQMLNSVSGVVYAFEPFPGNHRFFQGIDPRIHFIPNALADENKTMAFRVSSVVAEDSEWGRRGMAGYSSVGRLVDKPAQTDLQIDCVRADTYVDAADFVKLDLQGGELAALKGMSYFLQQSALLWVEYSGQPGLRAYLIAQGFDLYDTEYMFVGEPSSEAMSQFVITKRDVPLSTGRSAWFGFKAAEWGDFDAEFADYKKRLGLVQTDIVCVNRRMSPKFDAALARI